MSHVLARQIDVDGLANCAIHYIPEAYEGDGRLIVGRQSAGAGFLDALVRHGGLDKLYCLTDRPEIFEAFQKRVTRAGPAPEQHWLLPFDGAALQQAGCVFTPGPVISETAWMRRYVGERRYSICGITHSVATELVIRSIRDFMVSPTQAWDALICTSKSARDAITHIFETWGAYLAARGFAVGKTPVRFPIIPLGVHLDRFTPTDGTRERRQTMRARLGLEEDDVLVLNFGRLDHRSKAHPVPLFRAMAIADRKLRGGALHLAMVGQFSDGLNRREFGAAQQLFCPGVPVHWIDGADTETAQAMWAAADIFISLPDNVQESFGLTPVEAMAAGLPCIVSDWNGYKETVVEGETGFRIPTVMAPAGAGVELADEHARMSFDHFTLIAYTAQCTAIDIDSCAEAIARLAGDPLLRLRMGEAGRRRAQNVYDWARIIRQYQDLWAALAELRAGAPIVGERDPARQSVHPDYPDLFAMFAGHPSADVRPDMVAALADPDPDHAMRHLRSLNMTSPGRAIMLDDKQIDTVVQYLAAGPLAVETICARFPEAAANRVMRSLTWLYKFGLISLKSTSGPCR